MSGFTETTKEAFELYNQGNVKQALGLLTPGSKHYEYVRILEELKADAKLTKGAKKLIEEYKNKYQYELADDLFQTIVNRLVRMEEYDFIKKLGNNALDLYFNHEKPYYAQNMGKKGEENLGPNHWDQDAHYSDEKVIDRVYHDDYAIQSLHKSLWNEVDYSKLTDSCIENIISTEDTLGHLTASGFMKRVTKIVSDRFKDKQNWNYYSIPHHWLSKMTLEQMDTLKKGCKQASKDSNFKGIYFQKTYHYYFQNPEFYECASLSEKRDLFIRILSEYKEDQSLRTCLIRQILEYGIKLDVYDKNLFLEYLKYPISSTCLLYNSSSYNNTQGDSWSQYFQNLKLNHYYDDHKFYTTILEHYYFNDESWKDFEKPFDKEWIKQCRLQCDFFAGKELTDEQLRDLPHDLHKKVMIELTETNKETFKPDERVKIVVDLKNVTTLYVKVFEFNTLNYFKKTHQPFRTDVNLDGLIATKEFVYEYEEAPQKKHRNVFTFPHLDNQVGVFIIELIANGFSSRATIKKGGLSLVHKPTIAGQLAYIVNEEHKICCSEDTGIWLGSQFFKADVDKGGRILIPYEKYTQSYQAILVHDGFAHLESFNRLAEVYEFDTAFVLHPESLVMGNEASLLIRPKLTLNDRACDMKLLEN